LSGQQNFGLGLGQTSGQQLAGSSNFGAGFGAGAGGAGSNFQTKEWEKQSKWSSQNSVSLHALTSKI